MLKSRSQCFHRMFDYSVPSQNFFEGCVCRFYNGALLSSVNQSKIYWSRKKFVNMFSLNNILILSQFCNSKISTRSVTWDSTLNKVHALLQFFMTFWRVLLMARVFDVYFCWPEFLMCTFVGRSFMRMRECFWVENKSVVTLWVDICRSWGHARRNRNRFVSFYF